MDTRYSIFYTSHVNYWKEYPHPKSAYLKNRLNTVYTQRNIHLWVSIFIKPNRQEEILTALELNLNNPNIQKVTVILENSDLPGHIRSNKKLNIIRKVSKWRTKYSDIVSEINQNSNDINIIANNDMVLSYSNLEFLYRLTPSDLAVLSRWETQFPYSKNIDLYRDRSKLISNIGSSDVWIFIGKPNIAADIYLGIPGCENMFINEFYKKKYNIVNLGNIIPSYHLHNQQNNKDSYPFTYYLSSMYNLIFVEFYSELNSENIDIYSLSNLLSLNKYSDFYSKLSIIFSAFWNLRLDKDNVLQLGNSIDNEISNIKSRILSEEIPRIRQELIVQQNIQLKEIFDQKYIENVSELEEKCNIIYAEKIEDIDKQVQVIIDQKTEELSQEINNKRREEYAKIDQEIDVRKSQIIDVLVKFEPEYKNKLHSIWDQEFKITCDQKLLELDNKCNEIYNKRIEETDNKCKELYDRQVEQNNIKCDAIYDQKIAEIEQQTKALYNKKIGEIIWEADIRRSEEFTKVDKEINQRKDEIVDILKTFETEYKNKLQETWNQEFQIIRDRNMIELDERCKDIYNKRIEETNNKCKELYDKQVEENNITCDKIYHEKLAETEQRIIDIYNKKIEEANYEAEMKRIKEFTRIDKEIQRYEHAKNTKIINFDKEVRNREVKRNEEILNIDKQIQEYENAKNDKILKIDKEIQHIEHIKNTNILRINKEIKDHEHKKNEEFAKIDKEIQDRKLEIVNIINNFEPEYKSKLEKIWEEDFRSMREQKMLQLETTCNDLYTIKIEEINNKCTELYNSQIEENTKKSNSFYNQKILEINEKTDSIYNRSLESIKLQCQLKRSEELLKIDKEIEERKSKITDILKTFEVEYKNKLQETWNEEFQIIRDRNMIELDERCKDIYNRRLDETTVKCQEFYNKEIEQLKIDIQKQENILKDLLEHKRVEYEVMQNKLAEELELKRNSLKHEENKLIEYFETKRSEIMSQETMLIVNLETLRSDTILKEKEIVANLETIKANILTEEKNLLQTLELYKVKIEESKNSCNKQIEQHRVHLNNTLVKEKQNIENQLKEIYSSKAAKYNEQIAQSKIELTNIQSIINITNKQHLELQDSLKRRQIELSNEIDKLDKIRKEKLSKIDKECDDKINEEMIKINNLLVAESINNEKKLNEIYNQRLEELNKKYNEQVDYYNKIYKQKENDLIELERSISIISNEFNEKRSKYSSTINELQDKLNKSETDLHHKLLEIETKCNQFRNDEIDKINQQLKLYENQQRENILNDNIREREVLKKLRDEEHESERKTLIQRLNVDIEKEFEKRQHEIEDKLTIEYTSKHDKLKQKFIENQNNLKTLLESYKKTNEDMHKQTMEKFINEFKYQKIRSHNELENELKSKMLESKQLIDIEIREYEQQLKEKINSEILDKKNKLEEELYEEMNTLKVNKISELELYYENFSQDKVKESICNAEREYATHINYLMNKEAEIEKERIIRHNLSIRDMEQDFKDKLESELVKLNEMVDLEIKTRRSVCDEEIEKYKINLTAMADKYYQDMILETETIKHSLMEKILEDNVLESNKLKFQRETIHNENMAKLMQNVFKEVSARKEELMINMINDIEFQRKNERNKLDVEIENYKNELINKANVAIQELHKIRDMLANNTLDLETKRIQAFNEAKRLSIEAIEHLSKRKITEAEDDIRNMVAEYEERFKKTQLENNLNEDKRIIELMKDTDKKVNEYRKSKLDLVDKEIRDELLSQRSRIAAELEHYQTKETMRINAERKKYYESQKSIVDDRIAAEYEIKTSDLNKKLKREEELRMINLEELIKIRDAEDLETRKQKMKEYVIQLETMLAEERQSSTENAS